MLYDITHIQHTVGHWIFGYTINKGVQIPIETPFSFSITQNVCRPYDLSTYDTLQLIDLENWQTNNTPCGLAFPSSAPVEQDLRLAMNESSTTDIELLGDEKNSAVLVASNVPENVVFQMTTFGSRASCASINKLCNVTADWENGTCGNPPSVVSWNSPSPGPGFRGSISYPITNNSDGASDPFQTTNFYSELLNYPVNTTSPGGYTILM